MKQIKVIKERTDFPYSEHLLASTSAVTSSISAEGDDAVPYLAYFRVELTRVRTGMADFIMRVSCPKPDGSKPTVVTLRASRDYGRPEAVEAAMKVVFNEMVKRGDTTFKWDKANAEYAAMMVFPYCKFFVINPGTDLINFTTEALK